MQGPDPKVQSLVQARVRARTHQDDGVVRGLAQQALVILRVLGAETDPVGLHLIPGTEADTSHTCASPAQ